MKRLCDILGLITIIVVIFLVKIISDMSYQNGLKSNVIDCNNRNGIISKNKLVCLYKDINGNNALKMYVYNRRL